MIRLMRMGLVLVLAPPAAQLVLSLAKQILAGATARACIAAECRFTN